MLVTYRNAVRWARYCLRKQARGSVDPVVSKVFQMAILESLSRKFAFIPYHLRLGL